MTSVGCSRSEETLPLSHLPTVALAKVGRERGLGGEGPHSNASLFEEEDTSDDSLEEDDSLLEDDDSLDAELEDDDSLDAELEDELCSSTVVITYPSGTTRSGGS